MKNKILASNKSPFNYNEQTNVMYYYLCVDEIKLKIFIIAKTTFLGAS